MIFWVVGLLIFFGAVLSIITYFNGYEDGRKFERERIQRQGQRQP